MSTQHKINAIRGPINSWVFRLLEGYMDWTYGKSKRMLFKNHPPSVVEIGSGAGANMRYLKPGTKLVAIEPNIHMHKNLMKRAQKYGIDLEIKTVTGETIDLPDNSCTFVISTLVLCTVDNPKACVDQIKRILSPGGVFVFVEHVKAKDGSFLSVIQELMHRPWHWFFEGCNTNRDTQALLEESGFGAIEIEKFNSYSPFIPVIPQIRGRATT
jgi:ubiquinone/menaquinone biosynthesis C-methylase UbiE